MPKYETKDLRNLAFIGHGDSGKTSLAEAILFKTKSVTRLGSVADGTTLFDHDAEEKARKFSIDLGVAFCRYKNVELNLMDAPGYSDFVGEAVAACVATDIAVLCVNAAGGVMVNTRKMWTLAQKAGLSVMIAVNKVDLENIEWDTLIATIRESFGNQCVPVTLPIEPGPKVKDVVSVLHPDACPESMREEAKSWREKLIEAAIEVDETLMEKYLNEGAITDAEFDAVLPRAIALGKVVPIFATSVRADKGIEALLDFVARDLPSPDKRPARAGVKTDGEGELTLPAQESAPFSAQVFKVTSDPFVGRVSYFRVYSGSLVPDATFFLARTKEVVKFGKLFRVFGKDQKPTDKVIAGEIAAVAKIESLQVGDTLCAENAGISYAKIVFPQPMVSLAVEPKSRDDEQKIRGALQKLVDSDPTFQIKIDSQTHDMVITGMSQLHLEICLARLKSRFNVQVTTRQPRIPYKETVTGKAQGHHRHKKQAGGAGQFAEVYIRIEPLARGSGFEFADEVVGGSVPQQFIPSVEKGIRKVLETGVIAGYPFEDVRVALYDGKEHPVDSKDIAFQVAGREAFKKAVAEAKPVLLEPIVNIEITVPSRVVGDILGNLNSRRGRILDQEMAPGGQQIIRASIPFAEVMNYSSELRSMTGGEGSYSIELSHYDVVPARTQQELVAKYQASRTEEKED